MITIKEIAQLAGTSRGTVDRVLHKRGNVNPRTSEVAYQSGIPIITLNNDLHFDNKLAFTGSFRVMGLTTIYVGLVLWWTTSSLCAGT